MMMIQLGLLLPLLLFVLDEFCRLWRECAFSNVVRATHVRYTLPIIRTKEVIVTKNPGTICADAHMNTIYLTLVKTVTLSHYCIDQPVLYIYYILYRPAAALPEEDYEKRITIFIGFTPLFLLTTS